MRGMTLALAGMSLILTPVAAVAGEFTAEIDNAVEACVKAAVDKLPGVVTGWRIDWPAGGLVIRVNVLATNNSVWELGCDGGTITSEKSTSGSFDYQSVRARVMVPERTARQAAAAAYPKGNLLQMKYGRAWRGRVYYTYTFNLPDGREAIVQVNTATGRIDETSTERKS